MIYWLIDRQIKRESSKLGVGVKGGGVGKGHVQQVLDGLSLHPHPDEHDLSASHGVESSELQSDSAKLETLTKSLNPPLRIYTAG